MRRRKRIRPSESETYQSVSKAKTRETQTRAKCSVATIQPPIKRGRTTLHTTHRVSGHLQDHLSETPLDILFEVSNLQIHQAAERWIQLKLITDIQLFVSDGYPEPRENEQSFPRGTHEPCQCFNLGCSPS